MAISGNSAPAPRRDTPLLHLTVTQPQTRGANQHTPTRALHIHSRTATHWRHPPAQAKPAYQTHHHQSQTQPQTQPQAQRTPSSAIKRPYRLRHPPSPASAARHAQSGAEGPARSRIGPQEQCESIEKVLQGGLGIWNANAWGRTTETEREHMNVNNVLVNVHCVREGKAAIWNTSESCFFSRVRKR